MTIVTKCARPVGFGVTCDPVSGHSVSGGFRGGRPELGNAAKKTVHRYHVSQHEPAPINWWPLILAAPIVFLPLGFERRGDVDIGEWVLAWAGVLAFLVLFGIALMSWQRRIPFLWVVVPLAVLGAAYSYYVYTAVVFINYAACIVPWAVDGHRGRTARYTAMLVAVLFAIGLRMPDPDLRNWYWLVVPVFCITCAAFFSWVVRTCLELNRFAKVAERERIARDLHDVLGHTLSLIALKTELAGRILAKNSDAERARAEMADVENISRQALVEVQQTILGDRSETLEEELERASSTLRTAGIEVDFQRERFFVDAVHESVLGFALREAVTNIVRHSRARTCHIRLEQSAQECLLEVQDDGRGGPQEDGQKGAPNEGEGLRGMRERVEAIGGSVRRDVSAGTRLSIRLPASLVTS
jgi:two-component system, NarL family, sensor histidine kinase DesK